MVSEKIILNTDTTTAVCWHCSQLQSIDICQEENGTHQSTLISSILITFVLYICQHKKCLHISYWCIYQKIIYLQDLCKNSPGVVYYLLNLSSRPRQLRPNNNLDCTPPHWGLQGSFDKSVNMDNGMIMEWRDCSCIQSEDAATPRDTPDITIFFGLRDTTFGVFYSSSSQHKG